MTCEIPGCPGKAEYRMPHPGVGGNAFLVICEGCRQKETLEVPGWPEVPVETRRRAVPLEGPDWYGQRLRQAREMRGVDREVLAKALGIGELELWQIEQGKAPLTDELVALVMTRADLGVLVGFFANPPIPEEDYGLVGSSLLYHTPPNEICQTCKIRFAAALCDYPSCDRRLCDDCRVRPDAKTDYCPKHRWRIDQGVLL